MSARKTKSGQLCGALAPNTTAQVGQMEAWHVPGPTGLEVLKSLRPALPRSRQETLAWVWLMRHEMFLETKIVLD